MSGSVCSAFVAVILRLFSWYVVFGLASSVVWGFCWWYFDMAGPHVWFPFSTLCDAMSTPFFFVMPFVMASMRISASV